VIFIGGNADNTRNNDDKPDEHHLKYFTHFIPIHRIRLTVYTSAEVSRLFEPSLRLIQSKAEIHAN